MIPKSLVRCVDKPEMRKNIKEKEGKKKEIKNDHSGDRIKVVSFLKWKENVIIMGDRDIA